MKFALITLVVYLRASTMLGLLVLNVQPVEASHPQPYGFILPLISQLRLEISSFSIYPN